MFGSIRKFSTPARRPNGFAKKLRRIANPSAAVFERIEPRLLLTAAISAVAATTQTAPTTAVSHLLPITKSTTTSTTQSTTVAPKLTVTATGFTITASNGVATTPDSTFGLFGTGDYPYVTPVLTDGTLTYTYTNWTIQLTPTQDSTGIHFAVQFTNTGTTASTLPDFTVCDLAGNLTSEWNNNQTSPTVLDQTLADKTHLAFTVDDINAPLVAEFMQAANPANGTEYVEIHPTGGQYTRYDLGLVPVTIAPGASNTLHCSLRFGATSAAVSAATDAAWAKTFPYALDWTDHRQMLRGDMFQYDPTATNPQGCQCGFDINDPANFQAFDAFVMAYATRAIATCKACNAGTWIEWDLEGKQGGFNYKGSPQLIESLNPGWAYTNGTGVPLITRFFQAFEKAGINVGVCIRPRTLAIASDGSLYEDTSVSGVQSIANEIDYCETTWGVKAFYMDSPQFEQTNAYRDMILARPGTLVIPEDAPESWMQFSAPMVWQFEDVINWKSVPRSIYGNQGWGVYFHQDLTNATLAQNFLADAKLGSTVLTDSGWMGPNEPQVKAAVNIFAEVANPTTLTTIALPKPVVSVTDAGGTYNGKPFAATATAKATGIASITPKLAYYIGSPATGTRLPTAPSNPGTYTVIATVAATSQYQAARAETTFTIAAQPTTTTGKTTTARRKPPATSAKSANAQFNWGAAATVYFLSSPPMSVLATGLLETSAILTSAISVDEGVQ